MAGYSDPLGSQTSPAHMMDTGRMEAFSGKLPHSNINTDAGTSATIISFIVELSNISWQALHEPEVKMLLEMFRWQ